MSLAKGQHNSGIKNIIPFRFEKGKSGYIPREREYTCKCGTIYKSKASNSKSANVVLSSKFNSWEIGNSALNKVGFYIDKLNGNKDIFFINNNNLIGIGTNLPQAKLNVMGNVSMED